MKLEEEFKFLFVPGTPFTKADVDKALGQFRYTWTDKWTMYSLVDAYQEGPYFFFCREKDGKRAYRFFFGDRTYYDEDTFLKIGEKPYLRVLL